MYHQMLVQGEKASDMITDEMRKEFNKNYFIRYYKNSNDRHNNSLISLKRLAEIVGDCKTFSNIMKRIDSCVDDRLDVRLRRGISFTFVTH